MQSPLHGIPGGKAAPQAATPAHNLLAESTLLGAVLTGATHPDDLSGYLQPEHFYDPAHRHIYAAMIAAARAGQAVDETTLVEQLRIAGRIHDAGGIPALARLYDTTPSVDNVMAYVQIVLDCWAVRSAEAVARSLAVSTRQPVGDAGAFLSAVVTELEAIAAKRRIRTEPTDMRSGLIADLRATEERAAAKVLRCPTGFAGLDVAMGGGWPDEWLVVLGAQSETGKTAFAVEALVACADSAQRGGGAGLFLSFELSKRQVRDRFFSAISGMTRSEIENNIDPGKAAETAAYLSTLPIFVEEGRYFGDIRTEVRKHSRLAEQIGLPLRLVVIDFLQYVQPDAANKNKTREQELADMMTAMKDLRLEFPRTVFLVLSQVNKDGGMRGSDAIKHPADQTIGLSRPDPDDKTKVQLKVGKCRLGDGQFAPFYPLSVDTRCGRIFEVTP